MSSTVAHGEDYPPWNSDIYLIKYNTEGDEDFYLCNTGGWDKENTVKGVQTYEGCIYVFYSYFHDTVGIRKYDPRTQKWDKKTEIVNRTVAQMSSYNISYSNNKFYLRDSKQDVKLTYDIMNETWAVQQGASGQDMQLLTSTSEEAYYYSNVDGDTIMYRHNFETDETEEKEFLVSSRYFGDAFVQNDKLYVLYTESDNLLLEIDFDDGEITSQFTLLQGCDNGTNMFINNNLYHSSDEVSIYAFDPNSKEHWNKFFEDSGDIKNFLYGADGYYIVTESSGIQRVSLSEDNYEKTVFTYNDDGGCTAKTKYLDNEETILDVTETWTYISNSGRIDTYTDVFGNVTEYEYVDSDFGLPTKQTLTYFETQEQLRTIYTLTDDKKNIQKIAEKYSDGTYETIYDYDEEYGGNVTVLTAKFIDNEENEETLSTTEYGYDSLNLFIEAISITNIETNNLNFEKTVATNITSRYTYGLFGQMLSQTDNDGNVTNYEYNKNGMLTKVTNPDNTFVTTEYDYANNKITTEVNGKHGTVKYYDEKGRVIKESIFNTGEKEKVLTTYEYSKEDNNKIVLVNDQGCQTRFEYDRFGFLINQSTLRDNEHAPLSEYASIDSYITYSDNHRKIRSGNPYGYGYIEYNKYNQLVRKEVYDFNYVRSDYKSYSYDHMGNVSHIESAFNSATMNYDEKARLVNTVDAIGNITAYKYDAKGNVITVTNPEGRVIHNEYDSLNRLLKRTDSLGYAEYFAYDSLGNLSVGKDKNGIITSYEYDDMSRVIGKTKNDLSVIYEYDNVGNLSTLTNESGTISYDYKENGVLEKITTPDGKSIFYTYDDFQRISSVKDYNNQITNYTYNDLNKVEEIRKGNQVLARYDYYCKDEIEPDDFLYNDYSGYGYINKITYPEGIEEYRIDNNGHTLAYKHQTANGNSIRQGVYQYDMNYMSIKKEFDGTEIKTTNYSYDELGRLIQAEEILDNTADCLVQYAYDVNNNIMTKSITRDQSNDYTYSFTQDRNEHTLSNLSTHNITYAYNTNNQLLEEHEYVGGTGDTFSGFIEKIKSYEYDANGNTIKVETSGQVDEGVVEYGYNEWNQLISYTDVNGLITNYGYDGTGMRTSKIQNGTMTKFYWDRGFISNEVTDGTFTASNYIGINGIFARESGGNTDYMFKNGHGDVVNLVRNGQIVKTYDYDAYGTEKNPDPNDTNPFRYCGEYFDNETGQLYLRNRYYNPSIGRFITEDPIKDGINWYGYCSGNPVIFIDPFGLEDIYIFYGLAHGENNGFNDRATAEAEKWEKEGRSVKLQAITTEDQFVTEWNKMQNDSNKIEKVSLYFHSNPLAIIIDYTKSEYLTTDPNGLTSAGSSATYIGSLDTKDIVTLCLYTCNSAHLDYADNNVAITFFNTQNTYQVFGWDGSMRWSYVDGTPVLASDQKYFKSWLQYGERKPKGLIRYRNDFRGDLVIYIAGTWSNRGGNNE